MWLVAVRVEIGVEIGVGVGVGAWKAVEYEMESQAL